MLSFWFLLVSLVGVWLKMNCSLVFLVGFYVGFVVINYVMIVGELVKYLFYGFIWFIGVYIGNLLVGIWV